jgi:hypothetical protein
LTTPVHEPVSPDSSSGPSAAALRLQANTDRKVGTISAAGALLGATAAGVWFPPAGLALGLVAAALAGYKLVTAETLEREARKRDEDRNTPDDDDHHAAHRVAV